MQRKSEGINFTRMYTEPSSGIRIRRDTSFCNRAVSAFAKRSLDPNCAVVSDGLACFGAVADAGCAHQVIKTGSGAAAARTPAFKWVNTTLGNIKAAISGTYRAIHEKHVTPLDTTQLQTHWLALGCGLDGGNERRLARRPAAPLAAGAFATDIGVVQLDPPAQVLRGNPAPS
jgi:ISXO2-like transposase domain